MTDEPTRPSKAELSRELGRALEDIYQRTPDLSFEDLARSYRDAEASFLPKVSTDRFLTLEARRRVSELMLYSAIEKLCPFESCRKLLDELSRLGFTDLERKGNVHLIYARYCLQVRHEDEGVRLLEQLRAELEDELRRNEAPIYRQLLQTTLDVLGQLGS